MKKLTPKQERFVAEYLADSNATQAALRAGYAKGSAHVTAARMLASPLIKAAIDAKMGRLLNKLEITAERVLLERARLAFLDPRKLVDAKGKPLGIHQLDDDTAAAVAGFEAERGKITKLKLSDKAASLTALEKHLGLYREEGGPRPALQIHLHLGDEAPETSSPPLLHLHLEN
ncbi:terminase small subunit [Cupriavidus sp. CuC1]|uniref:terminase small subunit n=1 Tax=Cupriavidus sp. CuC1 TaxID=3373131 RepID=UPI0037D89E2D